MNDWRTKGAGQFGVGGLDDVFVLDEQDKGEELVRLLGDEHGISWSCGRGFDFLVEVG